MLELLRFIFSSFWIYLGFLIILLIVAVLIEETITGIFKVIISIIKLKQEHYDKHVIDMIDAEIED